MLKKHAKMFNIGIDKHSTIPHLMRNPEVYSKKKLEFSIETFRHGNHLVILRERSCQQLKYLFFFIFIILVKNWSGFPIKDFGNDSGGHSRDLFVIPAN